MRAQTLQILWDSVYILTHAFNNLCNPLWASISRWHELILTMVWGYKSNEMFCQKAVLKNCEKITSTHLPSNLLPKPLLIMQTPSLLFFHKFWECFQRCLKEYLYMDDSENSSKWCTKKSSAYWKGTGRPQVGPWDPKMSKWDPEPKPPKVGPRKPKVGLPIFITCS